MKVVKRLISLVIALCFLVSMTACTAKDSNTSAEATSSAATEASTKAEPREVELNVMMGFPQFMDQWESYSKQFEEKMLAEENIKVKVNLEMPASDQYYTVLQTRLTGDDAPDAFVVQRNEVPTYYKNGYLYDLSNEPLASKLYDNVKATVTVDGKLCTLPIESTAWGVLYNKDIFKECGLEVPNTLDELKEVCKVLKEKGYTPFMLAYQEQWVPQLMTALTIGGKVSGEVPDWLDRMYKDAGSYEEIKDIFDVIQLIMKNGTDRAMEEGSEAGNADFANGKAAMYVQGTWASNTIMTTNPNMNMGVFALPVNNNEKCTLINFGTSTTLGAYPQSKNLDVTLKFLNYVLDDKDSSALFKSCGFNPVATIHNYETSSWVQEAYKYVQEGRAYTDLTLPQAVTDEQGVLLQGLYSGSVTVDDIIKDLDDTFKQANKLSK
jgi:raffinose/stachyose/melibiose transport system substrate-binding protein